MVPSSRVWRDLISGGGQSYCKQLRQVQNGQRKGLWLQYLPYWLTLVALFHLHRSNSPAPPTTAASWCCYQVLHRHISLLPHPQEQVRAAKQSGGGRAGCQENTAHTHRHPCVTALPSTADGCSHSQGQLSSALCNTGSPLRLGSIETA